MNRKDCGGVHKGLFTAWIPPWQRPAFESFESKYIPAFHWWLGNRLITSKIYEFLVASFLRVETPLTTTQHFTTLQTSILPKALDSYRFNMPFLSNLHFVARVVSLASFPFALLLSLPYPFTADYSWYGGGTVCWANLYIYVTHQSCGTLTIDAVIACKCCIRY